VAVFEYVNFTLTVAPVSSVKVPDVIDAVFAAVAAAIVQVAYLLAVAPVTLSCFIV